MESNDQHKLSKCISQSLDNKRVHCELDGNNCLSLESILELFSVISEEHAWALCYQCAKYCAKYCNSFISSQSQDEKCLLVTQTKHLKIHRDGKIHPDTFTPSKDPNELNEQKTTGSSRVVAESEGKIISNLATVIFHALDFGLAEDQERHLSPELESLIEFMASASDPKDSQVMSMNVVKILQGQDNNNNNSRLKIRPSVTFEEIIELCTSRLRSFNLNDNSSHSSEPNQSESDKCDPNDSTLTILTIDVNAHVHYESVCRSMVAEALALSSFLQKISSSPQPSLFCTFSAPSCSQSKVTKGCSNSNPPISYMVKGLSLLDHDDSKTNDCKLGSQNVKINFAVWAQCWFQVMRQLGTQGVSLKKVTSSHSFEIRGKDEIMYTLSPYEMLMDDIRGRRYKLKKVLTNGKLPPRVKTDVHSLILEFVRSKPSLKKVEDRILAPPPKKVAVPREILMEEIRQKRPLKSIQRHLQEEATSSIQIHSKNNFPKTASTSTSSQ